MSDSAKKYAGSGLAQLCMYDGCVLRYVYSEYKEKARELFWIKDAGEREKEFEDQGSINITYTHGTCCAERQIPV